VVKDLVSGLREHLSRAGLSDLHQAVGLTAKQN